MCFVDYEIFSFSDCSLYHDYITVMMSQQRYAQSYMNGLTKFGEVTVNMIGNTNSTVYCSIP